MADFYPYQALPGFQAADLTVERQAVWGGATWYLLKGTQIASGASDAGNTPTTQLRHGLLMGIVTATLVATNYAPAAADGSQFAAGFLWEQRNMLDTAGNATSRIGQIVCAGAVQASQLLLLDEQARRQMQGRFVFDDRLYGCPGGYLCVLPKTANYQVVNGTDNNVHFTTTGATGSVAFTLPATVARGNRFRFTNTVGQTMAITAPTGKLIAFNNAAATTCTFSTSSNLIGADVEITVDDTGTKYILSAFCANTQTIT